MITYSIEKKNKVHAALKYQPYLHLCDTKKRMNLFERDPNTFSIQTIVICKYINQAVNGKNIPAQIWRSGKKSVWSVRLSHYVSRQRPFVHSNQ